MHLKPDQAKRLAGAVFGADEDESSRPTMPPGAFGNYRVLRLVGIGGMGEVYEATQGQTDRRVAIKVIRPELVSAETAKRFEHEARMLGRLQHPGIAQILEAGRLDTPSGPMPYFAMEYVEGRPLTKHASDLPVKARLELFLKVCDAVEHAHQKGIIHRDLKPGNILVDASGQPRILDFGVARATDADIQATTVHTDIGKLVGTLPYMSPEQVSGDPDALDTRSDVYALGVVLYELLAGKPPYDIGRGRIHEAARIIKETEPTKLSSISKVFRGDLETIAAKALEKERERRYQSVAELAGDVRRYLDQQPILARRTSAAYQFAKFAGRHRAVVAALGVLFVVLSLAIASLTTLVVREGRARADALAGQKEAEHRAKVATAVMSFIHDVLAAPTPRGLGRDARIIDVLEPASRTVEQAASGDDQVAAALHEVLGTTYLSLGVEQPALTHLKESLRYRERSEGPDDRDTILALMNYAHAATEFQVENPLDLLDEALRRANRALGPEDEVTLECRASIASNLVRLGRAVEARAAFEELLPMLRARLGNDDRRTQSALYWYGRLLESVGDCPAAERVFAELLVLSTNAHGDRHPDTISKMHGLAMALECQGRVREAIELIERAAPISEEVNGPDHPDTIEFLNALGVLLRRAGRTPEAETHYRELVRRTTAIGGAENPATLAMMAQLGGVLRDAGKLREAEETLQVALAGQIRTIGETHPETLVTMDRLVQVLAAIGQHDRAIELSRRVLALTQSVSGDRHPDTFLSYNTLARVLKDSGRMVEASAMWESAAAQASEEIGPTHGLTLLLRTNFGRSLFDISQLARAEDVLSAAIADAPADVTRADQWIGSALEGLVQVYVARSEWATAEQTAKRHIETIVLIRGPASLPALQATETLAVIYVEQQRTEEAVRLWDQVTATLRQQESTADRRVLSLWCGYGTFLTRVSRFEEAEAALQRADLGGANPSTAGARKLRERVLRAWIDLYDRWDKPAKAAEYRSLQTSEGDDASSPKSP